MRLRPVPDPLKGSNFLVDDGPGVEGLRSTLRRRSPLDGQIAESGVSRPRDPATHWRGDS